MIWKYRGMNKRIIQYKLVYPVVNTAALAKRWRATKQDQGAIKVCDILQIWATLTLEWLSSHSHLVFFIKLLSTKFKPQILLPVKKIEKN